MYTEEEAKELWCPYARVPGRVVTGPDDTLVGVASQNRGMQTGITLDPCMCVASKCMAWRWCGSPQPNDTDVVLVNGYCGLAGQP